MKKGVIIGMALVILGAAIFIYLNSKGDNAGGGNYPATYLKYKNNIAWQGGEDKPIISSGYFTGMARTAYIAAAAIPEVLDHLYCYCYCAEHHNHKSLRTCFTDGHGAGCDTCMGEAILAQQLHEQGHSIKDIRDKIDEKFYRPYEPE